MLVTDLIEIPHAELADWVALIGSALLYLIWATGVFLGSRGFAKRTGMRVLRGLLVALMLAAGLVGYFAVFVVLDSATYSHVVMAAFPNPLTTPHAEEELLRLSKERARSVLTFSGPFEERRIGFLFLPVVASAIAAVIVRRRRREVLTTRPAPIG